MQVLSLGRRSIVGAVNTASIAARYYCHRLIKKGGMVATAPSASASTSQLHRNFVRIPMSSRSSRRFSCISSGNFGCRNAFSSLVYSHSFDRNCTLITNCRFRAYSKSNSSNNSIGGSSDIESNSSSSLANNNEASKGTALTVFDFIKNGQIHDIDISCIRNFSVIAHIDHGKSTLSDALLQLTGNINEKQKRSGQVLDSLKVERERGITVKAQTASMVYFDERSNKHYLMNLIDTPGHIDFSYEVVRSLASCQGALLLVDSSQSIQAQTLSNHGKAKALGLDLIPIVTKIDLPNAQPVDAALTMASVFHLDPEHVIHTSAKKNIGIKDVFEAIVDRLPCPESQLRDKRGPFYGRIVDSWFDEHRGVVCLVQVLGGTLAENQRVTSYASIRESKEAGDKMTDFSVQEIGLLTPVACRIGTLKTGQVGYVIAGMRSTRQARIGDTLYIPDEWNKEGRIKIAPVVAGLDISSSDTTSSGTNSNSSSSGNSSNSSNVLTPVDGYEPAKPMLFASIYPVDTAELEQLYASVDRLCLNDSSIQVTKENSLALGSGLRCGFLGFLHMEVFSQRLQDEFGMEVITTTPSVPYYFEITNTATKEVQKVEISNIAKWPKIESRGRSYKIFEPMVKAILITPNEYYGALTELIKERRGDNLEVTHIDDGQIMIVANVPWQEVVCDMHDQIKNISSGYASFNYEECGYSQSELVKVEIAINNEVCEPLSFVSHTSKAQATGRTIATKLKSVLSRQQFEIIIQAKIGSTVLAKEKLQAYRKDVLSRSGKTVGGGDISRKKKLLEKQKEGKKRAKMVGKVEISQEAFWSVLQR